MSALTDAHIRAEKALRDRTDAAVRRIWRSLPAYNRGDIDQWLSLVLPTVAAAQRASVALTDSYLAREMGRAAYGLDPGPLSGAAVRNGATPEEVYTRPFVTTWTSLSEGADYAQAVTNGLDRALGTAAADTQLSMRAAASAVGQQDPGIYGFERVPDGDACDLCLIASTQRYYVEDLMPIHNRCGCSVEPITVPTGRVINRDLYRKLKADGAMKRITDQRQRARLEASNVKAAEVVNHGEMGPVLVDAAHNFDLLA